MTMLTIKNKEKNTINLVDFLERTVAFAKKNYDYILGFLFAFSIFLIFALIDFSEHWYELTRKYEYLELDELFGLFMGLFAGALWVTYARIRRARILAQRSALESDVRLHTVADQSPSVIFLKDTSTLR